MTEEQRDQLTTKVFMTPDGARFLSDLDDRAPYLAAELRQRIRRVREKSRGGKL